MRQPPRDFHLSLKWLGLKEPRLQMYQSCHFLMSRQRYESTLSLFIYQPWVEKVIDGFLFCSISSFTGYHHLYSFSSIMFYKIWTSMFTNWVSFYAQAGTSRQWATLFWNEAAFLTYLATSRCIVTPGRLKRQRGSVFLLLDTHGMPFRQDLRIHGRQQKLTANFIWSSIL